MGFRKFLISYIVLVATPTILLFLCSMGMTLQIVNFIVTIVVATLIMGVGVVIAVTLSRKVTKADSLEIQREDDVLLEAVAFSQSVLFLVVNLTTKEIEPKLSLSLAIALPAVTFYILRAWAKIKDSPKYRYYSMIAFAFISSATITSILKVSLKIPDEFIISIGTIYSSTAIVCATIAEKVFKKRYGYESSSSEKLMRKKRAKSTEKA